MVTERVENDNKLLTFVCLEIFDTLMFDLEMPVHAKVRRKSAYVAQQRWKRSSKHEWCMGRISSKFSHRELYDERKRIFKPMSL